MKRLLGCWQVIILGWLPIIYPGDVSAANDLGWLPIIYAGDVSAANDLGWLEGCWQSEDRSSIEVWVSHQSESLSGFSAVVSDNKLGFYEVLSIHPSPDGSKVYTATPLGQETTSFVSSKSSDSHVVFTNPDHDYPQQITYRRVGKQLLATISMLGGDNPNSFDKVSCD